MKPARAPGQSAAPDATPAAAPLFALVFRTGPGWVPGKPPAEPKFFREHSANLERLREAGSIRLGGRYADVGLIVVVAADEQAAGLRFREDPSIAAGTFPMELHPLAVFDEGCVSEN